MSRRATGLVALLPALLVTAAFAQGLTTDRAAAELRDAAVADLIAAFDPEYAGFGRDGKTAAADSLAFLLREATARDDPDLRGMVVRTVRAIGEGALRDRERGGLYVATLDRAWREPDRRKRLADNALFVPVALDIHRAWGEELAGELAREIVGYLLTTLRRPDGTFAAGERPDPVAGWSLEETLDLGANALAISALCRAAQAFDEPTYAAAAVACAESIMTAPAADPEIRPRLAAAAVDLYETTFEPRWLALADRLANVEMAGARNDALLATVLLRLSRLTESIALRTRASALLVLGYGAARADPDTRLDWLAARRWQNPDFPGIAVVGARDPAQALLRAVYALYLPERVIAWLDPSAPDADAHRAAVALFAEREPGDGALAYLCTLDSCYRPLGDPAALRARLEQLTRPPARLGSE